ncbi:MULTISPECIES: carbon storage regulator [Helicobacter]|uniref:Translational regulator CsrA n=1 Tax=Helicobacter typhlonius TaxID=76936 RepID=A0A099UEG8_9HELI|nr:MULTISPECIES: carbon storage regulator [Helicobacter]TLD78566.1 carbon storage regulator [Helicobacter typhlonius]TLD89317.1 carbon storage regulator [Helicobacter sp. MIT 03-1616]CUU40195.1 Carbon storage regulator [Helicobacter typhlonius]
MLILSRKQEDSVIIGDDIEVRVISIDKGSVRLGFSAPETCVILRGELKEAVSLANKQASQAIDKQSLTQIQKLLKAKNRDASDL